MKSFILHSAAMLALALGLASCGGKASFTVNVTVYGLKYDGLELSEGGDKLNPTVASPVAASMALAFPKQLSYGDTYTIAVTTGTPKHQTCLPASITGTAGRTATINESINCSDILHSFGGTVNGLTGTGLVLNYGSEIVNGAPATTTVAPPAAGQAAPAFTMPATIGYGTVYTVTVLTQPSAPNQVCTVVNGTGVMGDTDISTANSNGIVVNCQ